MNRINNSPLVQSWNSYPLLFKELRGHSIESSNLLADFAAIQIPPDLSIIDSAQQADNFFHEYGVGNDLARIDRPFERFHAYELLLGILADHDKNKYGQIHKGTPYYFLGWTAFQIENYEKGIYYFDQAIAEDIRKSDTTDISIIKDNPAVKSLLLDPQAMPAFEVSNELRAEMDSAFTRFSIGSGLTLNSDLFAEKFVIGSGTFLDSTFRTIITTMYSYALEYHTLITALKLRSSSGSSLEPFFMHLLKGGLLLESILKLKCPNTIQTLHPAISHLNGKLQVDLNVLKGGLSLSEVVEHIDALAASNTSFENLSFATAYGVRNTTGHNLIWSDVFQDDIKPYERLFTFTMNSLLWSIYKLWIVV